MNWKAEFLLDFSDSSAVPDQLDYVQLATANAPAPVAGTVRLSRYTSSRLPAGSLEVRVTGPDQTGFLARLLCRFVLVGLFLIEFEIDTQGTQIEDRFVLVSAGGASPSAPVQQSLDESLRSLCQG